MPARYVQYSHARTLNYLNCLRYTIVDSMPPVMLETLRMLEKVAGSARAGPVVTAQLAGTLSHGGWALLAVKVRCVL